MTTTCGGDVNVVSLPILVNDAHKSARRNSNSNPPTPLLLIPKSHHSLKTDNQQPTTDRPIMGRTNLLTNNCSLHLSDCWIEVHAPQLFMTQNGDELIQFHPSLPHKSMWRHHIVVFAILCRRISLLLLLHHFLVFQCPIPLFSSLEPPKRCVADVCSWSWCGCSSCQTFKFLRPFFVNRTCAGSILQYHLVMRNWSIRTIHLEACTPRRIFKGDSCRKLWNIKDCTKLSPPGYHSATMIQHQTHQPERDRSWSMILSTFIWLPHSV